MASVSNMYSSSSRTFAATLSCDYSALAPRSRSPLVVLKATTKSLLSCPFLGLQRESSQSDLHRLSASSGSTSSVVSSPLSRHRRQSQPLKVSAMGEAAAAAASGTGVDLFTPLQLGPITLPNRIIMAPLTRCRAAPGLIPTERNARYYEQRADAGLIITEATIVAPVAQGYPFTAGIFTDEQVEGWKLVTKAVHDKGGRAFLQLWHLGRSAYSKFSGLQPVAPSAIAAPGGEVPRALELAEISGVVEQFRVGAEKAKAAGFDGVEVHGANGYLIDQFLQDNTNKRTDEYGGPVENRARFMLEVVEAVIGVWGKERVGIRLSPTGVFGGMDDSNREATFGYAVKKLAELDPVYIHIVEPRVAGNEDLTGDIPADLAKLHAVFFRQFYKGVIFSAGGHDKASGNEFLGRGDADAIVYGRWYISNPDLVTRFKKDAPLNKYDRNTFYSYEDAGYLDYPFLEESAVAA